MVKSYAPPFTLTPAALAAMAGISELLGHWKP